MQGASGSTGIATITGLPGGWSQFVFQVCVCSVSSSFDKLLGDATSAAGMSEPQPATLLPLWDLFLGCGLVKGTNTLTIPPLPPEATE